MTQHQTARIPWFSNPIGLLSLVDPRARAVGRSDLRLLVGRPWQAVAWALAVGVPLGVLFSPGVEDVYTESLPFLLVAVAAGAAAPTLGVLLVSVFIPFDLIAYVTQARGITPLSLVGRVVTWWMLWLVAVELPILSRQAVWALTHRGKPLIGAVIGAGALAAAVAAWAAAMPYLLQPLFVWDEFHYYPTVYAVWPLQGWGWLLAVVAGVAAAATRPDRRPAEIDSELPRQRLRRIPATLPGIALTVVVTTALATRPAEYLILPAAFVAAVVTGRFARTSPILTRWLGRVPTLLRVVVGIAAVTLLGTWLGGYIRIGDDFWLFILIVSLGMVIFGFLLGPDDMRHRTPSILVAVGITAWLALSPATSALADNCAGGVDCNTTARATALAGAGGAAALGFESIRAARKGKRELKQFAADKAKGELGEPRKEYEKMVKEADETGKQARGLIDRITSLFDTANASLQGDTGVSED